MVSRVKRGLVRPLCHYYQQRAGLSSVGSKHGGFLEVREYDINPGSFGRFISLVEETVDLRKHVLPVVGLFKPDIGGVLNSFTHMYHYTSLEERDGVRAKALENTSWSDEYLPVAKGMMMGQRNALYTPAVSIMEAAGSTPVSDVVGTTADTGGMMIELRRYQLHPGYDTVPTILSAFEKGYVCAWLMVLYLVVSRDDSKSMYMNV